MSYDLPLIPANVRRQSERQLGSRISSRLMSAWLTEELLEIKGFALRIVKELEEIGGLPKQLLDTNG